MITWAEYWLTLLSNGISCNSWYALPNKCQFFLHKSGSHIKLLHELHEQNIKIRNKFSMLHTNLKNGTTHLFLHTISLMAQFSLYVHKGGLKPDSFHLHNISKSSVILQKSPLTWNCVDVSHNIKSVKINHICLIWAQTFANVAV